MNHLVLLPILLPMFCGAALTMLPSRWRARSRLVDLAATLALIPVAAVLAVLADDGVIRTYDLGDWPAPFGILLQLDRLAALMLALTALLGTAALLSVRTPEAQAGRHFHAIFQFQLMGLNGAFLAGDLFNLFVFFEILLMASYALLVHGNDRGRVGAGLHYVVLNLVGSSFFLIAIGILYGLTGTLNMAHLGERLLALGPASLPLANTAAVMLMLVFALKAAVFPLGFWLPRAYGEAAGPVAALFAVMTKVGVYAMLRSQALLFDAGRADFSRFFEQGFWWLGLATLVYGSAGTLAARTMKSLTACLVLVSMGLLLAAMSLQTPGAWSALLYYLASTTLSTAALFLLADAVEAQPGRVASRLTAVLYLLAAIAVAGLPPLSGFVGKMLLMQAAPTGHAWHGAPVFWTAVVLSSLAAIVAVSRTGSRLLWRGPAAASAQARRTTRSTSSDPDADDAPLPARADPAKLLGAMLLLASVVGLVVGARPLVRYLDATALQLLDRPSYARAILGHADPHPEGMGDGAQHGQERYKPQEVTEKPWEQRP
ncbi:monovalent cation/H+ antiporter subunit D [Cupriavidus sp. AU9028]|uniref:monovalent cation/H+ antiporter subunit D n=1 Tax=Cupriavidus sp. AU9028 TaxID=2871157 RepID=UPI001C940C2A|nr:monovalent cation/H+ antiporter subunit D [Cupriavidus sp. AU9028]MBY4895969.1 monovalent cation/H+ antiporter subunit D [Cupriavidus sp. AU9028]